MPRDPPLKEGESWDEAAGAGAGGRAGRRGAGGGALQLGRDLTQTRPGRQGSVSILYSHCALQTLNIHCAVFAPVIGEHGTTELHLDILVVEVAVVGEHLEVVTGRDGEGGHGEQDQDCLHCCCGCSCSCCGCCV